MKTRPVFYLFIVSAFFLSACLDDHSSSPSSDVPEPGSSSSVNAESSSADTPASSLSSVTPNSSSSAEMSSSSSGSPYYSDGVFCWTGDCGASSSSVPGSSSSMESSSAGSSSAVASSSAGAAISGATVTDSRDGNVYDFVVIGSLRWMSENLRYAPSGASGISFYDSTGTDGSPVDLNAYGALYNYTASRTACLSGWRLPTRAEVAAAMDSVDFPLLYGGRLNGTSYGFFGGMGFSWVSDTASVSGDNDNCTGTAAECALMLVQKNPASDYAATPAQFFQLDSREKGFSVRCVQGL